MSISSSNKTKQIYDSIKEKMEVVIQESSAVSKINKLTDEIKNISTQTNLLALNASIEAARAGEAGRGFAVVASEIGVLASQTLNSVDNINGIVGEINHAVTGLTECITQTMGFFEESILPDYKIFEEVGEKYEIDADSFKSTMNNINSAICTLSENINNVYSAIEEIDSAISQTAQGINLIAEKTESTVQETSNGYDVLKTTENSMDKLNDIVDQFKL